MNSKQWEYPKGWPETKEQRDKLKDALLERMLEWGGRNAKFSNRKPTLSRKVRKLTRPELGRLALHLPELLAERIAKRWPTGTKMRRLIERDGLHCHWCGRWCNPFLKACNNAAPTIEHVMRLADGGTGQMENLKVACRKCNNSRHGQNWKPRKPPTS